MYALRTICLLFFTWLLYQLPSIAQPNTEKPTQQSESQKSEGSQEGPAGKSQIAETQKQSDGTKPEDIPEKRLYHKYLRATIIGVGVSALVLLGIVFQIVWTIRAVQAAQKSADAIVASERAWVMVDVEPAPGHSGPFDGSLTMPMEGISIEDTSMAIRIKCRNKGRTPCWITEILARLEVADSLPKTPDFQFAEIVQVAPEPLGAGQRAEPKDQGLIRKKGRGMGKLTIVYGIVRYRDIFSSDKRSTTFAYRVRDDGKMERLSSYPAYNEMI